MELKSLKRSNCEADFRAVTIKSEILTSTNLFRLSMKERVFINTEKVKSNLVLLVQRPNRISVTILTSGEDISVGIGINFHQVELELRSVRIIKKLRDQFVRLIQPNRKTYYKCIY